MSKSADHKVYRLPRHSLAKIACYRRYLEIYLAILANTPFKSILILDLFSGEGRDIDLKPCSSIAAVEVLKEHYEKNKNTCNRINLFLNDSGLSVIEKNLKKIDRVKKFASEIKLPSSVEITYDDKKIEILYNEVIIKLNNLKGVERALCFIDPFGYKYSKPEVIRDLLANGKTEVLLFIPICFMHRFAGRALKDEDYLAGRHIDDFVSELFQLHYLEKGIFEFKIPDNSSDDWKKLNVFDVQLKEQYDKLKGNIFCMSAFKINPRKEHSYLTFNEKIISFRFALLIKRQDLFMQQMRSALATLKFKSCMREVEYLDLKTYSGQKTLFQKDICHSWQEELRIILYTEKFEQNDAFSLDIGSIEHFSEIIDLQKVNKIIYKLPN